MPNEIQEIDSITGKSELSDNHLLRSTELNEIISNRPGFLVSWGVSIFFLIFVLLLIGSYFIEYPDIVTTKAKLTSINAPKEVITKTSGKLIRLIITEGKLVQQNEVLGFMESSADPDEVIMLSNITDTFQYLLQNNQVEFTPQYFKQDFKNLGEVQQAYQSFMQGFILFNQYLSSGYYLKRKAMLQNDLSYLQKLHSNLLQQKIIQLEDLSLADTTYKMNKRLYEEKVIARLDYRNERSKFLNKSMSIPQINSSIISNESSQHEKQKEIMQLENEIAQQKGIFSQALNTLKSQLEDWKNKFVLKAPVNGKIAFATFLQENQQLQSNQVICFVNPENAQYYAEVYIPQTNFGKVKTGQEVLLKFPAYPFQEYGSLKGKLDFISNISTDSGYLAKVVLQHGLTTNYKKQIQFREGLTAQGEIVTANMRLLQRFYYSIIRQVK